MTWKFIAIVAFIIIAWKVVRWGIREWRKEDQKELDEKLKDFDTESEMVIKSSYVDLDEVKENKERLEKIKNS